MINLGSHQLPLGAATKTFAILAKRGAGKSYTGGVMAEEFHKNNIPFIVFDPIDVWWGLRFNKDGTDKGLPIVVFGVEHADIQLDRDMGKKIAQAVVKNNISCVISTFGMPKTAQRHLMAELAEELLRINNTPRHIFIEEAHEFLPQRVFGGLGKTFNSVSNLVVMGRNRGLGVTLINQRAATINKDVLTQIDTLLAFRNIAPQDRKALKEWVEFHAAEGDFEKFMQSLPSLPTGEGWIWSPEFLGIFEKIKIRERETLHPDRERLGDVWRESGLTIMEQPDIQQFIKEFSRQAKPDRTVVDDESSSFGKSSKLDNTAEIIALRNEYEGKIIAKDIEIRTLQNKLNQIASILNVSPNNLGNGLQVGSIPTSGSIQLWSEKLGNSGASRIFKFLAEKAPMKFTRSQIGLAVGLSSGSGSFATYIATLKRNRLIVEEGGFLKLNSDL